MEAFASQANPADGLLPLLIFDVGRIHDKVDDGESRPGRFKASPILPADGIFQKDKIAERFRRNSKEIDKVVSSFVYNKLKAYK